MRTPLDIERIRTETQALDVVREIRYVASVDSTNRAARELGSELRHGIVIITDFQESGRGRQGRSWVAPPESSLLLSIVLLTPVGVEPADTVMAAALAVRGALEESTGLRPHLKWPNDVLLDGRKVCGILADRQKFDDSSWVILGIGINVNVTRVDLFGIMSPATSLQEEVGGPVSREQVAVALFKNLDLWYRYLTQDPSSAFTAWAERLETIGKPVTVVDGRSTWSGLATGVQRDGALLVRDERGETQRVYAADVSIRQTRGFTTA